MNVVHTFRDIVAAAVSSDQVEGEQHHIDQHRQRGAVPCDRVTQQVDLGLQ